VLEISAVVITRNEGPALRQTVENLQNTLPVESEIVVVDDGSTDGSTDFLAGAAPRLRLLRSDGLGVARARNWGACQARGDLLVFADAHITMEPEWWVPMADLLTDRAVGAVAPAVADVEERYCKGFGLRFQGPNVMVEWLPPQGDAPYPVALLPGCCWAMRRDTFQEIGGFDEGMICWGTEDSEMSVRLWLLGYELRLLPQVEAVHLFRVERPFPVEWSWALHNRLRLALLHFDSRRVARVMETLRGHEAFAPALALAEQSDAAARRAALDSRRVRDDDWFFRTFGPEW
jgi:GT2 family glycosyltransferase